MSLWNRPGRKYFPDEQVHPDEILRVLQYHRIEAPEQPWLAVNDVGWRVGVIVVQTGLHMAPQTWDMERRCRTMPWGYRWRHRIAERDVRQGLLDLEARGVVARLPRWARGWAYWVAPQSPEELAAMVAYFADQAEQRARLKYETTKRCVEFTRRAYRCDEVPRG